MSRKKVLLVLIGIASLLIAALVVFLRPQVTPAKSEAELLRDLQTADTFISRNGFAIETLTVEKRQTRPEDYRDIVYVRAELCNSIASMTVFMRMDYTLYNEGWILEGTSNDRYSEWNAVPLAGADEQTIQNQLDAIGTYYLRDASLYSRTTDLAAGNDELIYSCTLATGAVHMDYQVRIPFVFDEKRACWIPQKIDASSLTQEEHIYTHETFQIINRQTRWDTLALAGEYRDEFDMMGSYFYLTVSEDGGMFYQYQSARYDDAYMGSISLAQMVPQSLTSYSYTSSYPQHFVLEINDGVIESPLTSDGWDSVMLKYD